MSKHTQPENAPTRQFERPSWQEYFMEITSLNALAIDLPCHSIEVSFPNEGREIISKSSEELKMK